MSLGMIYKYDINLYVYFTVCRHISIYVYTQDWTSENVHYNFICVFSNISYLHDSEEAFLAFPLPLSWNPSLSSPAAVAAIQGMHDMQLLPSDSPEIVPGHRDVYGKSSAKATYCDITKSCVAVNYDCLIRTSS